jgi:glycerophosphoryl diester phosphodiesterase
MMRTSLPKISMAKDFFKTPIAHRGYHDCGQSFGSGKTENSLSAIESAIQKGFGIEIDLQLTKDGIPVVYHDYNLKRLSGFNQKVKEITFSEIREFSLPNGEKIPSIYEALELINGKAPVFLEMKDQDGMLGSKTGYLESRVANALENYSDPLAIMSFNPYSVLHFGKLMPNIPRGLVTQFFY